ncbi:MAG: hypothetical protein OXN89_04430 [Bryobacterales bacterium]|nr:hypothetical protein [Bryobacterales bacterium]
MERLRLAGLSKLAVALHWAVLVAVPLMAQDHPARHLPADGRSDGTDESWTVPRTAWGVPDLRGTWSYASLTPLERPAQFADQEQFSPEQAAGRNAAAHAERPHIPGNIGSYNAHWFDKGRVDPDRRTSLIVDPPNGRLPTLTPVGHARVEARKRRISGPFDSWLNFTAWTRCITYHGVPPVSTGYNNTYQIFQSPGYVAILVENIHDVRIIPLDGRPALDQRIRQWNGDSRGHWEGDTLVVETGNFSDKTEHRYPSSKNLRAVERFTRVSDDRIRNEFSITDPDTYTESWTALRMMPRLEDYVIYEYACHEGNYAMTNALSGARAEERAGTARATKDE